MSIKALLIDIIDNLLNLILNKSSLISFVINPKMTISIHSIMILIKIYFLCIERLLLIIKKEMNLRLLIMLSISLIGYAFSALRFGEDDDRNDLSIEYIPELSSYLMIFKNDFDYIHAPFSVCFRHTPIYNHQNGSCSLCKNCIIQQITREAMTAYLTTLAICSFFIGV